MHNLLTPHIAEARVATLRADAAPHSRTTATPPSETPSISVLAVRIAHDDERPAVRRLADLDGRPAPAGDVLLGLVNGEPIAAISVSDGAVVADPFVPTADAVAVLRLRAEQLRTADAPRARRASLRFRFAR